MTDDQLLRYSRHILLNEVGIDGQERFLAAHALVIGAGGLGSPVALYLGSAGLGQITLVDHDTVDLTNLQRQVAHTVERIGMAKVESAKAAIAAMNPGVQVNAVQQKADAALLQELVPKPAWCSTALTISRPVIWSTLLAYNMAYRWYLALQSVWMPRSRFTTLGRTIMVNEGPAMPACSLRPIYRKKPAVRPWAFLRRWWALSAPCRQPWPCR